jgi:hypothetical protein
MTTKNNGVSLSGEARSEDLANTWTQEAQRHYEPQGNGELTTAIVSAVADAEGVAPSDLTFPPLYEVIDAPALEDTFFGTPGGTGTGTVEFTYEQYLIRVKGDGWIQVYESTETETP